MTIHRALEVILALLAGGGGSRLPIAPGRAGLGVGAQAGLADDLGAQVHGVAEQGDASVAADAELGARVGLGVQRAGDRDRFRTPGSVE
jgi:hypothetical protein